MNYRSINDLNACIVANLHRLPCDIELIVGIPRSGLLAANLVALHLNLPMTDFDGYVEGRLLSGGWRLQTARNRLQNIHRVKALILDDSVASGRTVDEARARVRAAGLEGNSIFGCVFAEPSAVSKVDFHFGVCPMPRVFEWNIFHHQPLLDRSCVDIDGVLCRDPLEAENDDGEKYCEFLSSVTPLLIPSVKIGALVTCRLEKYRALTAQWLKEHGVQYGELIMMQYPNKQVRIQANRYAEFKAEIYAGRNAELFIESSAEQARSIVRLTNRSVFCVDTREMLVPSVLPVKKFMRAFVWRLRGIMSRSKKSTA